MTNGSASLAHPAPENSVRLTTLDPAAGYTTIINAYTVASERAEALLHLLVRQSCGAHARRPPRSRMVSRRCSMNCGTPRPHPAHEAELVSFMSVGQTMSENG